MSDEVPLAMPAQGESCITTAKVQAALHFLSTCCAIAVIIISVINLMIQPFSVTDFTGSIANVYKIMFGLVILGAEWKIMTLLSWIRLLVPYFGLGFFYVFVAIFVVGPSDVPGQVVAVILTTIGCTYCYFGCTGYDRGVRTEELQNVGSHSELLGSAANPQAARAAATAAASDAVVDHAKRSALASIEDPYAHMNNSQPANPFENANNPFESNGKGGNAYS